MPLKVKVVNDTEGQPTSFELVERGRTVSAVITKDGLEISGRLTDNMRDVLKYFLPHNPKTKEFFEGAPIATANADVLAGGAAVTANLYTVPIRKKLYILTVYSSVANNGGVGPWGDVHIYDPVHDEDIDLVGLSWNFTATDGQTVVAGPIDYGFPSGFIVQALAGINSANICGFIGVLKDV